MPIFPVWLVFQTTPMSPKRSDITAAKISTAASVGIGTSPTSRARASRMTSIQTPAKMAAHRLRAPAATFNAVLLTEPPTGVPWKMPDARFATPCPMKSRFVRDGEPSGFGAASDTPAPCTSAIAAIANAPVMTPTDRSDSCGKTERRQPAGDRPDVGHRLHAVQPHQRDHHGRHHHRDQGGEQRDPGAAQQEHHGQRGHPDDRPTPG